MELLEPAIEPDFEKAGWFPERSVAVPECVPEGHPAVQILRAFGGLRVTPSGSHEHGDHNIEFSFHEVTDSDARDWESALRTRFVGIAECENGHSELVIDTQGWLFLICVVAPIITLEGRSFAEGVGNLLYKRVSQPMLLPWQASVRLFGELVYRDDERILTIEDFANR